MNPSVERLAPFQNTPNKYLENGLQSYIIGDIVIF